MCSDFDKRFRVILTLKYNVFLFCRHSKVNHKAHLVFTYLLPLRKVWLQPTWGRAECQRGSFDIECSSHCTISAVSICTENFTAMHALNCIESLISKWLILSMVTKAMGAWFQIVIMTMTKPKSPGTNAFIARFNEYGSIQSVWSILMLLWWSTFIGHAPLWNLFCIDRNQGIESLSLPR